MIRHYTLGMPHLLFGGLSERWLLEEAGDMHTRLLLADSSFLRVRWRVDPLLSAFHDRLPLTLLGSLSRFGDSLYFSRIQTPGGGEPSLLVEMAALAPDAVAASACPEAEELPEFGGGHRLARALGLEQEAEAAGVDPELHQRQWSGDGLWTTYYDVNPYYDFNSPSRMYFASFPRIHDICERQFVHAAARAAGWTGDWATATSVRERDIFYYGNAAIDETLRVTIHAWLPTDDGRIVIHSSLVRASDGERIADLYTVKTLDTDDAKLTDIVAGLAKG
jgi:probable biosynthetic protein (TIGR04098 family)